MKNFNFSPLKILSSCGIILTFIFGIWFADDRYISAKELNQEKKQIYIKMNMSDYRALTKQYYEYRKLIKENMDDSTLRDEFNDIKKERIKLKEKIDLLLEGGEK